MAASLEQTTQIISGISFITHGSHIAYVSTQIKQSRLNSDRTLFIPRVDLPHVHVHASILR